MKRANGFSLLEVTVVLAVFAVVALIGVQVIQSSARSNERLTEVSNAAAELAQALALLRSDLRAAVPRGFAPPEGGTAPALRAGQAGFALSVGGLARLTPGSTGFGRVVWRHDAGNATLTRQVWTTLEPAAGRPPDVLVLRDVQGFSLESFVPGAGWRAGFPSDPRNPGVLPLGLRVRLDHARTEGLEIVVSLR